MCLKVCEMVQFGSVWAFVFAWCYNEDYKRSCCDGFVVSRNRQFHFKMSTETG